MEIKEIRRAGRRDEVIKQNAIVKQKKEIEKMK
jgi:hypothetical protein